MTILRTPDERFDNLPHYPFEPHYVDVNGLRMHYVDEGNSDETVLCIHGEPTWSYLYRKIITPLSQKYRVIAPDLIGFGRSDKYQDLDAYSYQMHVNALVGFLEALDLSNLTLVVQDWGGVLGLSVAANHPERFSRLVVMNTFLPTGEEKQSEAFLRWRGFTEKVGVKMRVGELIKSTMVSGELAPEIVAAYDAPFPDNEYKAGVATFPLLVPIKPGDTGADEIKAVQEKLKSWDKPALVMFSDSDLILGGAVHFFRKLLPTAKDQPEIVIKGAGHFLQEESGAEIAGHIDDFIGRT